MRRLTLLLLALAMAALSLGLTACTAGGGGGSDETATLDLVIGDLYPAGESGGKAPADLASDEISSAIKESGADHTVDVVQGQDAQKLVDADGATCLASAEPTNPVSGAASAHTAPGPNVEAPALATDIEDALHGADGKTVSVVTSLGSDSETAGVVAPEDADRAAFADYFQRAWEDKGGTIGDSDPDATVIATATALDDPGIDPETTFVTAPTPTSASGFTTLNFRLGPDGARGVVPAIPDDADTSTAFEKLLPDSVAKAFPGPIFQAQSFDAVILCYLGAVAAASTNGADIGDEIPELTSPEGDEFTWEQLAEAIDALENGDDIDYVGASGQIDMDVNGDPTVGAYDPFEVKNGKVVPSGDQITAEAIEG